VTFWSHLPESRNLDVEKQPFPFKTSFVFPFLPYLPYSSLIRTIVDPKHDAASSAEQNALDAPKKEELARAQSAAQA
jgi:hypothetical protein